MKRPVNMPGSATRLAWVTTAMLLVLASAPSTAAGQQPVSAAATPSADTIEKGKQHFVTYACYACHGFGGQESGSGPRIDTTRTTFQVFVNYVRLGTRQMPPFRTERQIPDSALAEIYAYLESLPPPPDPKSIPLLMAD